MVSKIDTPFWIRRPKLQTRWGAHTRIGVLGEYPPGCQYFQSLISYFYISIACASPRNGKVEAMKHKPMRVAKVCFGNYRGILIEQFSSHNGIVWKQLQCLRSRLSGSDRTGHFTRLVTRGIWVRHLLETISVIGVPKTHACIRWNRIKSNIHKSQQSKIMNYYTALLPCLCSLSRI